MADNEFRDKIILVTGGTGSIGSVLVSKLLEFDPKQIRIYSRNDSRQYRLLERFNHDPRIRILSGDVRDFDRLDLAMQDVDIVYHAAALKHVPICEYNPFEAVQTNIIGSQNVIRAAAKHRVKKVIGISTDKVANASNVLGITKLMMEKLFINSNFYNAGTIFSCVRFGNVAWAEGSVLPVWKKQAAEKGRILVTDSKMTRFLMSLDQAADLVFKATNLMKGGEIFVFKMAGIKLTDLAKVFVNKYFPGKNISIQLAGIRAGEKIHEQLVGHGDENSQIFEDKDMLIIFPAINTGYRFPSEKRNYPNFRGVVRKINYSSDKYINKSKITKII